MSLVGESYCIVFILAWSVDGPCQCCKSCPWLSLLHHSWTDYVNADKNHAVLPSLLHNPSTDHVVAILHIQSTDHVMVCLCTLIVVSCMIDWWIVSSMFNRLCPLLTTYARSLLPQSQSSTASFVDGSCRHSLLCWTSLCMTDQWIMLCHMLGWLCLLIIQLYLCGQLHHPSIICVGISYIVYGAFSNTLSMSISMSSVSKCISLARPARPSAFH